MYQSYEIFETEVLKNRCISVIGSGGKTTFLRSLSKRLQGTVILTTSTRIYPFRNVPLVTTTCDSLFKERSQILKEINSAQALSRIICVGQPLATGKLTSPEPSVSFIDLLEKVDFVLIEADGSAGHPLKAHRSFEPVIPTCSDLTVCLIGASGIGKPVGEVCHCPELFSSLAAIHLDQPADIESIATVLNQEDLADWYLVNQVDTLEDPEQAIRLCHLIRKNASICSLSSPVSEVLTGASF